MHVLNFEMGTGCLTDVDAVIHIRSITLLWGLEVTGIFSTGKFPPEGSTLVVSPRNIPPHEYYGVRLG